MTYRGADAWALTEDREGRGVASALKALEGATSGEELERASGRAVAIAGGEAKMKDCEQGRRCPGCPAPMTRT
jgi:hypothetical protein